MQPLDGLLSQQEPLIVAISVGHVVPPTARVEGYHLHMPCMLSCKPLLQPAQVHKPLAVNQLHGCSTCTKQGCSRETLMHGLQMLLTPGELPRQAISRPHS